MELWKLTLPKINKKKSYEEMKESISEIMNDSILLEDGYYNDVYIEYSEALDNIMCLLIENGLINEEN